MKFAVEQRIGAAIMLLQEVRNWQGGQGVLPGYELFTDLDGDTAVAIPKDLTSDVRECVLEKKYTFLVMFGTIWGSIHLPYHGSISVDDLCLMLNEMEQSRHQSSSPSPHF